MSGGTRPAIEASVVATGKGDDGTTCLWYVGLVPKFAGRPEAYGSVDEAASALGLALRLWLSDPVTRRRWRASAVVRRLQLTEWSTTAELVYRAVTDRA